MHVHPINVQTLRCVVYALLNVISCVQMRLRTWVQPLSLLFLVLCVSALAIPNRDSYVNIVHWKGIEVSQSIYQYSKREGLGKTACFAEMEKHVDDECPNSTPHSIKGKKTIYDGLYQKRKTIKRIRHDIEFKLCTDGAKAATH